MKKIDFKNRIQSNPRLLRLKNPITGQIIDYEIQDLQESEIVENGTEMTAEVLNEMQSNIEESCVAVSPTQPETNEKVWIQKGKNLFNDGLVISKGNCTYNDGVVAQTTADTKTQIEFKIQGFDDNWGYIGLLDEVKTIYSIERVFFNFTKTSNLRKLTFGLNGSSTDTSLGLNVSHLIDEKTYTLSFDVTNLTQGSISWENIQIEQGSTATEYEEYIEETIWVKNDNGVYIPFVPKNKPINITTGVEFETGRIINGRKEYGKMIYTGFFLGANEVLSVPHGLTNFSITKIEGVAHSSSNDLYCLLPHSDTGNNVSYNIYMTVNSSNIIITSNQDISHYDANITLYYVKL